MDDPRRHRLIRRPLQVAPVRVALVLLLALLPACDTSNGLNDDPAAVVLVVGNITQLSSPWGDVLTSGGIIPEDSIEVQFTGRLKNSADTSGTGPPLQEIIVQRYEVTFKRLDGGDAVPAGFQRGMNARVRITPNAQESDIFTNVQLVLVPSTSKSQPPVSHLISPGFEPNTGFVNIQVNATIRFFGHTVSGVEVAATATIGVNFADFGDNNS